MTTTTIEPKPSMWERPITEVLALDWEKALYLVLIIGAFVTRFYDLGVRAMSHDESLHTQYAWYLYEGRGFQHSPLMHGPLKFELTAFTYWLLGDNDFTARLPTALMGVAAVGLFYYFRKWLGRAGALVGAVMMLISPYMLYYSRYIRDEPYVITWGMLVALCVINYMETRAAKYLYWLAALSALFYATMEASFIYIAITMLFLGLHVVRELFAVSWPNGDDRRYFQIAFAVTLAAILVAVASLALSRATGEASGTATAAPADPNAPLSTGATGSPLSGVMLLAMVVAGGGLLAGTFFVFRAFGDELRRFPVLDVLMVLGLFVLPQLTAFPVRALGRNPVNYSLPATTDIGQLLNSDAGVTAIVCVILFAISFVIGWLWDWKKFLICAGIFYGIYIPLFTTFFTNGGGIATGIVGSLGYWLEQHGVKRGNQPLYYYVLINLPIYEFLPTIGALFAATLGAWKWWQGSRPKPPTTEAAEPISPSDTLGFPVIGYFGFWAVGAILAFSVAGEKMPWLTTHMALPLILVAAWGIGQLIDSLDWQKFREQRGLLLAAILPLTVVAVFMTIGTLLGANPPAQGSELPQQQATLAFGSALVVSLMGIAGVYFLGRNLGWGNVARLAGLSFFGLLALITARAAFIAAYVNYDDANEYLVYAHGGRGVKTMMAQIEDISKRTTGGLGLKVAYDDKWSWPGSWYLRDYPNQAYYGVQPTREQLDAPVVIAAPEHYDKVERLLKDNYYQFEYLRMVWPMQDYFGWENPADGLPISPGDCRKPAENMSAERKAICDRVKGGLWTNAQYRQALWNIWWDRNYTLYGELTNQTYDLSNWPVTDKVKLYVRKDVAAQIWSYGVGPSVLSSTVEVAEYDAAKKQVRVASLWGSVGSGQSQFRKPRGVAVGPDGSVYVADSNNHRIQKFDADGKFVLAWGSQGVLDAGTGDPGKFNEPWGVAVGPDGSVYVADTWNHRVQKFDADGNFITMWGRFGNDEAPEAFWGPRGIAVDPNGNVYVADTGNKRVAIFDANGVSLNTIGSGGYDPGQFDEPVGLAFAPNGSLYVADTWNQRIQMFTPNAGGQYIFIKEWEVLGWFGQGIENKPFLAVDEQSRVYVTDPEGYRVLVFDATGNFLTMWGDYGFDQTTFNLPLGIAVSPSGDVYVADAGSEEDGNQRIMKFPPLP